MDKVIMSKADLLAELRSNLISHKKEFEEAKQARRDSIYDYLIAETATFVTDPEHTPDHLKSFPKVVSHEDEYKTVIRMLEFSVSETIEIATSDFERYVMDTWHWSAGFKDLHSTYNKV